jgi:hypothetical protein
VGSNPTLSATNELTVRWVSRHALVGGDGLRQALVIAVVVWLAAACSMLGGREAAPAGFRDTACGAYGSLTFAHMALGLGKPDMAAGYIVEGRRSLATVPEWLPGAPFVDRLQHVSDVIGTSDAGPSLDLVDTEYRELYDKNGLTCEWIFWPLPSPLWPSPAGTLPATDPGRETGGLTRRPGETADELAHKGLSGWS